MRRRLTTAGVLGAVFALILGATAIATAAPPDFCDPELPETYKPDHPSCVTTTTATTVPEPPTPEPCPSGTFQVAYSPGTTTLECDWILPNDAPTPFENGVVTAHLVEGKVRTFTVMVRDSSPGDICELSWDGKSPGDWEWYQGQLTATEDLELTFPLQDDRGPYWDFAYTNNAGDLVTSNGEHWCGPYDPIEGLRTDSTEIRCI